MNITIVGSGNAGTTVGADLSLKGHTVTLLKTSDRLHNENFKRLQQTHSVEMVENEACATAKIHCVTTDYSEAMKDAELVIIYVQSNYHQDVIRKLSPYIKDGQCFLIEPGYLSTCYFLQETQKDITIIEAESSPIDCRIISPGKVQVLFRNVRNPFGVFPKERTAHAKKVLDALKFPYTLTSNVVEAALHNPNLIVHTIGAIFSIPRIEYSRGDYWMYREVFTPHVWNVVESLDSEKMDVLERLGCPRLSYVEACKMRNSLDDQEDALAVFFDYAMNSSPKGPDRPDSRYITEDVPEGLVLLESLGEMLNIATPTCTGLINCASAAMKRDFRAEGKKIERLGYDCLKRILENT